MQSQDYRFNLGLLPPDVLFEICGFLTPADIFRLLKTNMTVRRKLLLESAKFEALMDAKFKRHFPHYYEFFRDSQLSWAERFEKAETMDFGPRDPKKVDPNIRIISRIKEGDLEQAKALKIDQFTSIKDRRGKNLLYWIGKNSHQAIFDDLYMRSMPRLGFAAVRYRRLKEVPQFISRAPSFDYDQWYQNIFLDFLKLATEEGSLEVVNLLLRAEVKQKLKIETRSNSQDLINKAIASGNIAVLRAIISAINIKNIQTNFAIAADNKEFDMLLFVIENYYKPLLSKMAPSNYVFSHILYRAIKNFELLEFLNLLDYLDKNFPLLVRSEGTIKFVLRTLLTERETHGNLKSFLQIILERLLSFKRNTSLLPDFPHDDEAYNPLIDAAKYLNFDNFNYFISVVSKEIYFIHAVSDERVYRGESFLFVVAQCQTPAVFELILTMLVAKCPGAISGGFSKRIIYTVKNAENFKEVLDVLLRIVPESFNDGANHIIRYQTDFLFQLPVKNLLAFLSMFPGLFNQDFLGELKCRFPKKYQYYVDKLLHQPQFFELDNKKISYWRSKIGNLQDIYLLREFCEVWLKENKGFKVFNFSYNTTLIEKLKSFARSAKSLDECITKFIIYLCEPKSPIITPSNDAFALIDVAQAACVAQVARPCSDTQFAVRCT